MEFLFFTVSIKIIILKVSSLHCNSGWDGRVAGNINCDGHGGQRLESCSYFASFAIYVYIVTSPSNGYSVYHRERILETSTLSCNEEEEEITKPPKR